MQGDQEGQKAGNWGAEKVVWAHEHFPLGLELETGEPVRAGRALSGAGAVVLVLQWLLTPSQHLGFFSTRIS